MVFIYNIKNPPKRKIPKYRVPRSHHYIMIFPEDLLGGRGHYGFAYINFFDSFLEDCVKIMARSYMHQRLYEMGEFDVMTACLN